MPGVETSHPYQNGFGCQTEAFLNGLGPIIRAEGFHIGCAGQNDELALVDPPFCPQVLLEAWGDADNSRGRSKTHSSCPYGEEIAQAPLSHALKSALLQQVRIHFKHKRNPELSARPCSTQRKQVEPFVNQVITFEIDRAGLRHAVAVE